jgi:hypothetical protein
MIHKQFLSREGNPTILPPLHCHRQKRIARVSVALNSKREYLSENDEEMV